MQAVLDGEVFEVAQPGVDAAQRFVRRERCVDAGLACKPGALRGSKPLAQWRIQGRWPESYDQLWELMNEKYAKLWGLK